MKTNQDPFIDKPKSYLDRPELDGTKDSHPAFFRGRAEGLKGTRNVILEIIRGKDDGLGVLADKDLEVTRRILIDWYNFFQDFKDRNNYISKKIIQLLEETENKLDSIEK